jgi:hypothetical protein
MATQLNEQFNKDEKFGKWGEETLIKFIEGYFNEKLINQKLVYWYDSSYQANNKSYSERKSILKSFDLKFGLYENENISPKKSVTFEIKTDKFMNTGNVVIEKKYKKQPSGVFGSSADYFIYFFPRRLKDQVYIIKREKLVEMFESDTKWNEYLTYGGDNNSALMYVIPSHQFENDFLKSGGKLETYEVEIPEEFGLDKFIDSTISYVSNNNITNYPDAFDFD